jgi:hypothetical protein
LPGLPPRRALRRCAHQHAGRGAETTTFFTAPAKLVPSGLRAVGLVASLRCGACLAIGNHELLLFIVAFMYSSGGLVKKCTARSTSTEGLVHLAHNPSFSACFFSRNSIFLL